MGRHVLDLTYPADRQQGAAQFEDLLAGRAEAVTVEKRYRHRDGYPFWAVEYLYTRNSEQSNLANMLMC